MVVAKAEDGATNVSPSCVTAPPGAVSWWRGEGTGADSVGNNGGTFVGNVSYRQGYVGRAFSFDGNADAVCVGAATNLQLQDFTIEAWIKRYDTSRASQEWIGGGVIFGFGQGGYAFVLDDSGQIYLTKVGYDGLYGSPTVLVKDTNYHHVAVTKLGTNVLFYVDGVSYAANPYYSTFSFETSAAIGKRGDLYANGFLGEIDEVTVYNRQLSSTEIQTVYTAGSSGKCDVPAAPSIYSQPLSKTVIVGRDTEFTVLAGGTTPLVCQWYKDGVSIPNATNMAYVLQSVQTNQAGAYYLVVSNAYGSVTSSNAVLTVTASTAVALPEGLVGWWRGEGNAWDDIGGNSGTLAGNTTFGSGVVGQGFAFDGTYGTAVSLGNASVYQLQDFTIETWLKRGNISGSGFDPVYRSCVIFGYGTGGYGLSMDYDGSLVVSKVGYSGVWGPAIVDTNFHHVVVTKSGPAVIFYVDGVASPTAWYYGGAFYFDTSLTIGSRLDVQNISFLGIMDEVSLYNRPLAATEVQALFDAGSNGKIVSQTLPKIVSQPTSKSVLVGQSVTFAVVAAGSPAPGFQWQKDGVDLVGATNAFLTISAAQTNDSGHYLVKVNNALGTVQSSEVLLTVSVPNCVAAPSGLVSWWRAEANAGDSIGVNSGTLVGNTYYQEGFVGQAFVFDGNNDAVSVGGAADLQIQDFTVEAWIKRENLTKASQEWIGGGTIFGFGTGGYGFVLDDSGQIYLTKVGYDGVYGSPSNLIKDTNYHHVAVTKQGTDVVFYIDGVAYTANPYNSTFSFDTSAAIGKRGDLVANGFLGEIDEVAVYNRQLSADEIQAIYMAGDYGKCDSPTAPTIYSQPTTKNVILGRTAKFSVLAGGSAPLAYQWFKDGVSVEGATNAAYSFQAMQTNQAGNYYVIVSNTYGSIVSSNAMLEVSLPVAVAAPEGLVGWWRGEGNAWDEVGNNTGSLVGSAAFGAGAVGQGFAFDGTRNTGISLPNSTNYQVQNLTMELWIQRANTSSTVFDPVYHAAELFGYGSGGYALSMLQDGSLNFSKVDYTGVNGPAITDTNLHHVVVTKSGYSVTFYVDGVSTPANYYFWDTFYFNSPLSVGGGLYASANSFSGILDEVSLYNRALTASEIESLFDAAGCGKLVTQRAPVITSQPIAQKVIVTGRNVAFNVVATGSPLLVYQWQKDGVSIQGATNASYTVANATTNDSGAYSAIVRNSVGTVTSSPALLTVNFPSSIPAPSGLVGWWRGEGNAWNEVGTQSGTPMGNTKYGPGYIGQGFVFDGTRGTAVSLEKSTNYQVQDFTIETWLQRGNTSSAAFDPLYHSCVIFGYGTGGFGLSMNSDGSLVVSKVGYSGVYGPAITDTNFHHVVVTKSGMTVSFFVDGVLKSSSTYYGGSFFFNTSMTIGSRLDVSNVSFLGTMDEVSLYNRPLDASEVQSLFDAGSFGKSVTPVAPTISSQPLSQSKLIGANAAFSVTAIGTPVLSYRWQKDGAPIMNATNSSLMLTNVQDGDAGTYSVIVTNSAGLVKSANATLSLLYPPTIAIQPKSQSVSAGNSVTLNVVVSGTAPFAYQWQFNGKAIPGAIGDSLTVNNIQAINAGDYSVLVSNAYGSTTSSNAVVTIQTSTIKIGTVTDLGSRQVSVPVELLALGTENAVGFSLDFDSSILTLEEISLSDENLTFISNTNQSANGRIGLIFAMPIGQVFAVGTQNLAQLTFSVAPVTSNITSAITFGGQPTSQKVSDANANPLPAIFAGGYVLATAVDFEGDVSPKAGGDRHLDVTDWVQVGRYVAGLDTITSESEFQRVDCAPRRTLGNGVISVTDWVQAGRYAAGLDPLTAVGGPTKATELKSLKVTPTKAGISAGPVINLKTGTQVGGTNKISVQIAAQGGENAIGFSLNFDTSVVRFVSATAGAALAKAQVIVNTNGAKNGILGVAVALPSGNALSAGVQDLIQLTFASASYRSNSTTIAFVDSPVRMELSDASAQTVAASFASSPVEMAGLTPPSLTITEQGTNVLVSWPVPVASFTLQHSGAFDGGWTDVTEVPVTNGANINVTLPASDNRKFFRLKQ